MSSDVIARTETVETAKMWHKSIHPEDCVQGQLPGFSGIEIWLFDNPPPKALKKKKDFDIEKLLDLRSLQLQCTICTVCEYTSYQTWRSENLTTLQTACKGFFLNS